MSNTHTVSSDFITFHEPIKDTDKGIMPLYDPIVDFNIPHGLFNIHYKTKWVPVFDERTLTDKILFRHPVHDEPEFSVDVVVKVCSETEGFINHMKNASEPILIPTPTEYKNF